MDADLPALHDSLYAAALAVFIAQDGDTECAREALREAAAAAARAFRPGTQQAAALATVLTAIAAGAAVPAPGIPHAMAAGRVRRRARAVARWLAAFSRQSCSSTAAGTHGVPAGHPEHLTLPGAGERAYLAALRASLWPHREYQQIIQSASHDRSGPEGGGHHDDRHSG